MEGMEDREQRTEDGGRRTEGREQRTEDRGRRTEGREQRTEDGGLRTEDGGQRSGVRSQGKGMDDWGIGDSEIGNEHESSNDRINE